RLGRDAAAGRVSNAVRRRGERRADRRHLRGRRSRVRDARTARRAQCRDRRGAEPGARPLHAPASFAGGGAGSGAGRAPSARRRAHPLRRTDVRAAARPLRRRRERGGRGMIGLARAARRGLVAGLALLAAGCATMNPPPSDTPAGREVLLTVAQPSSSAIGLTGPLDSRYLRRRGYGAPPPDVDRVLDQLAREHGIERKTGWPIRSLGVYCEV